MIFQENFRNKNYKLARCAVTDFRSLCNLAPASAFQSLDLISKPATDIELRMKVIDRNLTKSSINPQAVYTV